jgi:ATP-binding cassette subfamily B protein
VVVTAPRGSPRTLVRLLLYVARHRGLVAWSVVTMIALAVVDLALPEIVKRAIDGPVRAGAAGTGSGVAESLALYGAVYLGVLALGGWIRGVREVISVRAGRLIGMSLRMDVFAHVQRMGLPFFDRHPVGVLTTRVTNDVESIEEFFQSGVAAVFHDLLKLGLILVVLFVVNAKLALVVLAVIPPLAVAAWAFTRWSRRDFGRVRAEVAASNAFTTEAVGGVRVTRLFQQEERARRDFAERTEGLMGAHLATVRNFASFFPVVDGLSALAVALVLAVGASQIAAGAFTYGEFFQFYLLIDRFFEPIRDLSERLNVVLQAMVSGERVFAIADAEPTVKDRPGASAPERVEGRVTFEDVHFRYLADDPVLQGISFDVPAGTTTALVGPTGGGKSTILSLISRFYDPDAGRVTVDGRDVRDFEQRALRKRVAVVLQDVFLFRGSVLENIRLFDAGISRERVEAAVRAVHADDVVARLARGLDSPVEERGVNLSVGERQLIAFARALVHDPAILVLDEATSSIDTATEQKIQEALETLRRGRTTIVVAHRLSTIRQADQILVVARGQVRERGDHATLLRQNGLYRRLYELQARQTESRA